jgi:hypothetical protein
MKIDKLAQKDAETWTAAEMFYGEGAGTRRKLVGADVDHKIATMPGYLEAFEHAYAGINRTEFAERALRERKALDRAAKASQNLRAIKSGNLNNLTTGVAVVVGAAYLAHATGFDKKIEAEAKRMYKKAKVEFKFQKARLQGRNVEKIFG